MIENLLSTDDSHEPLSQTLRKIPVRRNVAVVSIITGSSAFLGFGVHMLVAKHFGASLALDAFLVGFILLYFVQNQFQAGDLLNSSFIPAYNLALHDGDESTASFFSTVVLSIWLAFSVLSLACLFMAPHIVNVAAPGLSMNGKLLATQIFRLFALILPFVGVTSVLASLMRADGKFFAPTAGPLVVNVFVVLLLSGFSEKYGIMSYVAGWLFGCVGQFAIVIEPLIKAPGFVFGKVSWKNKHVGTFFKKMGLLLIDVPIGILFLTIERSFASQVATGTVSHLNYAHVIYTLPLRLLAAPIQTVMFSRFAQQAALGHTLALREQVERTFRLTIFLILPAAVLLIFFRTEIVRLLLERGNFNASDTAQTSSLLLYFGISMIVIGLWWLFRQISYSMGDMASPLLTGFAGLIVYFLGNLLLIDKMGASALALSWVLAFFASDVLLGGILAHKLGGNLYRRMIPFFLKITGAICLVLLFLSISTNLRPAALNSLWSTLFHLFKYGLSSLAVYLTAAWLFRIGELRELMLISKEKLQK